MPSNQDLSADAEINNQQINKGDNVLMYTIR
jgi:hypothetical protein